MPRHAKQAMLLQACCGGGRRRSAAARERLLMRHAGGRQAMRAGEEKIRHALSQHGRRDAACAAAGDGGGRGKRKRRQAAMSAEAMRVRSHAARGCGVRRAGRQKVSVRSGRTAGGTLVARQVLICRRGGEAAGCCQQPSRPQTPPRAGTVKIYTLPAFRTVTC